MSVALASLVVLGGLGLLRARRPATALPLEPARDLPRAFLCGTVVLVFLQQAADLLALPAPFLGAARIGGLLGLGAVGLAGMSYTATRGDFRGLAARAACLPRREVLVWAVALVALVVSLDALVRAPYPDWDSRTFWRQKTLHLLEQPSLRQSAFRDPWRLHVHPRYPTLAPQLAATLALRPEPDTAAPADSLLDGPEAIQAAQGWDATIAWAALALLLAVGALGGPWAALLWALTAAAFGGIAVGQVEILTGACLLAAALELCGLIEGQAWARPAVASAALAGLALSKNEGVVFALALGAGTLVAAPSRWKRWAVVALGTGLLLLPWLLLRADIPSVSDEGYTARLFQGAWALGFQRLPAVAQALGATLADIPRWGLLWCLAPFILAAGLWRGGGSRALALALLLSLTGASLAFVLSPWHDLSLHVAVAAPRVLLPLAALLVALGGMLARGPVSAPGDAGFSSNSR